MKKVLSVLGMALFYIAIAFLEEIMTAAIVDDELTKRGFPRKDK